MSAMTALIAGIRRREPQQEFAWLAALFGEVVADAPFWFCVTGLLPHPLLELPVLPVGPPVVVEGVAAPELEELLPEPADVPDEPVCEPESGEPAPDPD